MTSDELQAFYARDLEAALRAGDRRRLPPKSARWMLAETRRGRAAELADADGAWIWSDLHLHHRNIIRYAARPHASVVEMDAALLETWRSAVAADDVIICAGDVALAGALGHKRIEVPGRLPGAQAARAREPRLQPRRPARCGGCRSGHDDPAVAGRSAAPRHARAAGPRPGGRCERSRAYASAPGRRPAAHQRVRRAARLRAGAGWRHPPPRCRTAAQRLCGGGNDA